VLDLRLNPGGLLQAAVEVSSLFLPEGKRVVATKSRSGQERAYNAKPPDGRPPDTSYPIAILFNRYSASASEIVAAALQDHIRAIIIGERSYGKGSVQDLKPLKTTGNKSAVKVTISKWYLPNGRSVEKDNREESGVLPDVKVSLPERDFWRDWEVERIRSGDKVDEYLKAIANKDLFDRLAESDGGDLSRYPDFDAFYATLETKAEKDDIRELVRELIRKRVQDDLGKPLYIDFQMDTVLQRAILEACKLGTIDPKQVKEYALFAKAPGDR
jgi:hypothetical protein